MITTTDEFPVYKWAKTLMWAIYAQAPAGRRERRILTNPDVQAAFAESRAWLNSPVPDRGAA